MTIALLCIDLVNDCIHEKGKLSEGFTEFEKEHNVLQRISRVQEHFREQGGLVIHTRTVFSPNHYELCTVTPFFKKIKEKNALVMNEWGTEFPESVAPKSGEPLINKHRFGTFYRTRLEIVLRAQNVKELYIVGLSTLGSVAQSAIEGIDRDFKVTVIEDCCIARNQERHEKGLALIEELADVKSFNEIALRITEHSDEGMRTGF